jgi:hypothetical protein
MKRERDALLAVDDAAARGTAARGLENPPGFDSKFWRVAAADRRRGRAKCLRRQPSTRPCELSA